MKRLKMLFVTSLMLLASLFVTPAIPAAHAGTGNVCLTNPGSTSCATSLTGSPGDTLRIAVIISGSDPLNGFDIQIKADRTILQAVGVDTTGTILSTGGIFALCIDGVLKIGNLCAPQDGLGVLHLAYVSGLSVPGNGLLFTALYTVMARTVGISVDFNTGCPGTSVPGTCVTISNGSLTPNTETSLGTVFANLQDFSIKGTDVSVPPSIPGTTHITVTSEGGYSDFVDLIAIPSAGLTVTPVTPPPVELDLTSLTTASADFTVSAAVSGTYTLTVTGTGVFSPSLHHSVIVKVFVNPTDFSLSSDPASLTIAKGSSGMSTINMKSMGGFTGTVGLTATTPAGVTASLDPASLVGSGLDSMVVTSTLKVTVAGSVLPGDYSIAVAGSATIGSHSITIPLHVPAVDFSIKAVPDALGIPRTGVGAALIVLDGVNNFGGDVSLSISIAVLSTDSSGSTIISTEFTPMIVTLAPGGTGSSSLTIFTTSGTATGFYKATITGTSGSLSHDATLLFNVEDFRLVSVDPSLSTLADQPVAQGGAPVSLTATIESLGGLTTDGIGAFTPGQPARGRLVPELGFRVCLLAVFYPNGTQIPFTTLAAQGPVADAGAPDGCRFDATTFIEPDLATCLADGGCTLFPEVQALSNTPTGTYIFRLGVGSGILFHSIDFTVVVVSPTEIHQLTWNHRPSVAVDGAQTFKVGVKNPACQGTVVCTVPNPPLYVVIDITLVDSTGTITITKSSAMVLIASGTTLNNILVTVPLDSSLSGVTFGFSAVMHLGTDPTLLTGTSTVAFGAHSSGSFLVLP